MAYKRSRSALSQSLADMIALYDQPSPPPLDYFALHPNEPMWLHPHDDQSHQNVFSAPFSPLRQDQRRRNDDGFLQRCNQCKKMLDHTKNIYMYKDSGFCRPKCRNMRIAKADAREKAKSKNTSNSEMNR